MTLNEIKKAVTGKGVFPLYCLHGENSFAIEEAVKHITETFLSKTPSEDELILFDGQSHTAAQILEAVMTPPLFSEKKAVMVKRSHLFEEKRKHQFEKFDRYFENPSPNCCLILTAEKNPLQSARLTRFKKKGLEIQFAHPKRKGQKESFINTCIQEFNLRFSREAKTCFLENAGADIQLIRNELEKLSLFCMGKKEVSVEDIEETVSFENNITIFRLVDELGMGHLENALMSHYKLGSKGVYPLVILAMVIRQFRLITLAKEALCRGDGFQQISNLLSLRFSFQTENIIKQAKGWRQDSLNRVFGIIQTADAGFKSSAKAPGLVLENMIFNICRLKHQACA